MMVKYQFVYLFGVVLFSIFFSEATGQLEPQKIELEVGLEATFICRVQEKVKWSYRQVSYAHINTDEAWERPERRLPWNVEVGRADSNSHYLRIPSVQIGNQGIYTCTGIYNGRPVTSSGKLLLNTKGQLNPPKELRRVGQMAVFECEVDENVIWLFNGGLLPQKIQVESVSGTHILHIFKVEKYHEGTYTCEGIYDGILKRSFGQLIVVTGSFLSPPEQRAKVGEVAYFRCDARNNVRWEFNGGPLRPHVSMAASKHTNYIHIPVREGDEGTYTCKGDSDVYQGLLIIDNNDDRGDGSNWLGENLAKEELKRSRPDYDGASMDLEDDTKQNCPSLNINNGLVSLQNNDRKTAIYRCSYGYQLNGPVRRQCEDGQWSGSSPTCKRVSSFLLLHAQTTVIYSAICAIIITEFDSTIQLKNLYN